MARNYILLTYDSDNDEITVDKLYCTKQEAKRYIVHEMYDWIRQQADVVEDNDCVDSVWISEPRNNPCVEFYGTVQFDDYHITFQLMRSKLMQKTEIDLPEPTQVEKILIRDGGLELEDKKYNWETGKEI